MKRISLFQLLFFILSVIFLILAYFFNFYEPQYPEQVWYPGAFPEALKFIAIFSFPFILFTLIYIYLLFRGSIESKIWKWVAAGINLLAAIIWIFGVVIPLGFACFDQCPTYIKWVYIFGGLSIISFLFFITLNLLALFRQDKYRISTPSTIQSKTNIKYLFIVIVLAAIIGGGILAYQYWWMPEEKTESVRPIFPESKKEIIKDSDKTKITFGGKDYCIIQEAQNSLGQTAFLTSELCWDSCSLYVNPDSVCDIFVGENSDLRHVAEVSFMNKNSLFRWKDPKTLLIGQGFGGGGGSFLAIQSVDVNTSNVSDIIRAEQWESALEEFPTAIKDRISANRCFIQHGEAVSVYKKGNHSLSIVDCMPVTTEEASPRQDITTGYTWLAFDNEILFEKTIPPEERKTYNTYWKLDLVDNALNGERFDFVLLDTPYTISFSNAVLKQFLE